MVTVLVLLVVAGASIFLAPRFLRAGGWRLRHPRLALTLWLAVFLGGVIAAGASVVVSLVLAIGLPGSPGTSTVGWFGPTTIVLFGWLGLAAAGATVALVLATAEPMTDRQRRIRAQVELFTDFASGRTFLLRGVEVVVINCEEFIAFSVGGADRRIIVSSRLERELSLGQLQAVIEHERAHLVQRHGRVAQVAEINRACLPGLDGPKEFERAVRLLIELIADDAAARASGAVNVANALLRLGRLQGNEGMILRAQRIAAHPPRVSVRLHRTTRADFVSGDAPA